MPNPKNSQTNSAVMQYQKVTKSLKTVTYISLVLGIIAIVISLIALAFALMGVGTTTHYTNSTTTTTVQASTLGSTLAGIDDPLNTTQLAIINGGSNSYFEQAGEMYINGTLTNNLYDQPVKVNASIANNKTAVIYLGSITCIFCGENRWAMALALSRFGNFSKLFIGYSSLGDGDVPTLYWTALNYNVSSDNIGNYYSSPYVNFLSIEDTHPISGGFALNNLQTMDDNVAKAGNSTYISAFGYLVRLFNVNATAFKGTPYTVWGNYQFNGADAIDFGNTTPTGNPQLTYVTHAQVFSQLAVPKDQFAFTEYAAADLYVAALCASLTNSTRASVSACSLPAIKKIELQNK